ncbi:MAG: ferredoxin, partial [Rhodospirillaceae bacterium]|nr:ferredoxin [Rhodospirillaceae bacterium]
MTSLPHATNKKLGLVIDLDTCVGCHACATNCKQWNTGGHMAPLTDKNPYAKDPDGVWFNRVHSFEVKRGKTNPGLTVNFPRSC